MAIPPRARPLAVDRRARRLVRGAEAYPAPPLDGGSRAVPPCDARRGSRRLETARRGSRRLGAARDGSAISRELQLNTWDSNELRQNLPDIPSGSHPALVRCGDVYVCGWVRWRRCASRAGGRVGTELNVSLAVSAFPLPCGGRSPACQNLPMLGLRRHHVGTSRLKLQRYLGPSTNADPAAQIVAARTRR